MSSKLPIVEVKKKILLLLIIVSSLVPLVSAFETSYSVMPGSGSYNENIVITVRGDPIIDEKPMWVSIYWDKRLVKSRIPSPAYGKTQYQHRWDITITPPAKHAEEGKHSIEIWIENQAGGITVNRWQYTVDDGLPPFSVWEAFLEEHPEILIQITGPEGPIGGPGLTGPKGDRGIRGATGNTGPTGERGRNGVIGLTGAKGAKGVKGDTGAGPSLIYFGIFVLVSVIISCGFTYYWTTIKEAKLRIDEE